MTDGRSNSWNATLAAANALHASNIYAQVSQVYAVGVNGADPTKLNGIVSDPSLVFFTSNYDNAAIAAIQQNLTQQLCNSNNTSKLTI